MGLIRDNIRFLLIKYLLLQFGHVYVTKNVSTMYECKLLIKVLGFSHGSIDTSYSI